MSISSSNALGASLIAQDGQFLGKVTNEFDSDSIANEFGDFGSKFGDKSIRNEFGSYGGEFSDKSPYSEFTSTPPKLMKNGQFIGYVTKNEFLSPRIDPDVLINWAKKSA